ncbi:hypothetical protein CJU89_5505 [Yarrowia sp. B02]|nr:hypothetical protein CJU89_5505 [Yarrowia sp. B02]
MKFSLVSLAAIASLTLAEFTDVLNGVSNANDEVLAELQTLPVANLADLTSKLAAQKAKIEALSSQAPTSDTFTIQANDVSVFQKQIADQTVQFAEGPQSEALKGLSEKLSAQAAAIAGLVGSGDDEETTTQWETRTTTVTMLHTDVTEIIVASTETSTVPVSTSSTSLQPVAVAVASASAHASAKVNIFFGGKLDYSSSPFMKGALGNGTTYGNTTYVNGTESYVTLDPLTRPIPSPL